MKQSLSGFTAVYIKLIFGTVLLYHTSCGSTYTGVALLHDKKSLETPREDSVSFRGLGGGGGEIRISEDICSKLTTPVKAEICIISSESTESEKKKKKPNSKQNRTLSKIALGTHLVLKTSAGKRGSK